MVTVGLLARRKWPIQCGKSSMYVVETLDIAAVELEEATVAAVHCAYASFSTLTHALCTVCSAV